MKKKKTDPVKLGEFILKGEDIEEVADFGTFAIVKSKKGIMFKTYTGFHVWTAPYVLDLNGKAQKNSLYAWLESVMEAKVSCEGKHGTEMYPETDVTRHDMLEAMKIITEANILYPITAFTNLDTATDFAQKQIKWLRERQDELANAVGMKINEEVEAENFELSEKAVEAEKNAEILGIKE